MKSSFRIVLVYLLPVLHLGACLAVSVAQVESGVEIMGRIDLPFTILIAPLVFWSQHPMVWIAILGTVWWYFLSRVAEYIFERVWLRRAVREKTNPPR